MTGYGNANGCVSIKVNMRIMKVRVDVF